ncbi:MAG: hypothetical protein AVDCRST_MAG79-441 [uncultured Thermoleophilia bacterium]|uniref:Aminoglycoside phosphotransferase domain-containing protein n=1 Tax=uncultured Thermoleophilia bacterium TaxID=1497501 RepID=A0A6J4TKQ9_9ACTN|nr:MAG: hypothetical protein AVDCRST_MAG79-441 [uncultured Thermoleophilia bacterium]
MFELLHPDGPPARCAIWGDACPDALRPERLRPRGAPVDVIVLAPAPHEFAEPGWLEDAAAGAAAVLAPDGLVCLIAPRRARRRARGLLRDAGLAVAEPPLIHVPTWTSDHHVFQLTADAARFAGREVFGGRSWKKRVAPLALERAAAGRLLAGALRHVTEVARRPGGRPLFEWLLRLGEQGATPPGTVIVRVRRRASRATALLHRVEPGGVRSELLAKLSLRDVSGSGWPRDTERIERFGAGAARAGAQVPRASRAQTIGGHPVLVQTRLPGRPAATIIAESPTRAAAVMEQVAAWLAVWNRATVRVCPADAALFEREITSHAALVVPRLAGGQAYHDWLAHSCAGLAGEPMPQVVAHGDLTMANVVVDDRGGMGVVDWETAHDRALPLGDAFYALADAAAATNRYADRVGDFVACFDRPGGRADHVGRLSVRVAVAARATPAVMLLAFHACWLHHAANEERDAGAGGDRPFLGILQWIADRHRTWRPRGWG